MKTLRTSVREEKQCTSCKQILTADRFYQRRNNGFVMLRTICKECWYKYNTKYLVAKKLRYPEKENARLELNRAVKRGYPKPINCERCDADGRIHAHHYDYQRSLDVLWLCVKCHEWVHHTNVGEALAT